MSKPHLESRLARLEATHTPPSALLIRRFTRLLRQGERLPTAIFTARLDAFVDTCSDAELTALLEHLDHDLAS